MELSVWTIPCFFGWSLSVPTVGSSDPGIVDPNPLKQSYYRRWRSVTDADILTVNENISKGGDPHQFLL